MLDERVQELEKKLDKEIKYSQALAKRVVILLKEEATKKEEASLLKKETTKDMVAQWSEGATIAMGGFCPSLLCYHCSDVVVATGVAIV
jgi:hypothetical protein